jgi:type II restriction enzyme
MRKEALDRRAYWVSELARLSGKFGDDSTRMVDELRADIVASGVQALTDHLRLCGAIPEQYGHDSTEEKLYSKYTDAVVSEALTAMGLRSTIIAERADAADVQARGKDFSLVADAKAFRLSRTAKNQKDFKVQAMDGWRGNEDYAIVVCPIYQLPTSKSQIYQQAFASNVCIASYSHLSALVVFASKAGEASAEAALRAVLDSVALLGGGQNAADYWHGVNGALVASLGTHGLIWTEERNASLDALQTAKAESLFHLRAERNRLLGLSHQEALDELIRMAGVDARILMVERIQHGGLLGA